MTTTPDNDSPWYPDDSGEWVEHDGSGMPVPAPAGVNVLLRFERDERDYRPEPRAACGWDWRSLPSGTPGSGDIVAYRLV
jgi:hypothetical protein